MPAPQNLTDVYVDELRDLWSANDQMQALVKDLVSEAEDGRLKETLQKSVGYIAKHTATLESLLVAAGGEASKERCRAMEGLIREARKHIVEEAAGDGVLSDLTIIAHSNECRTMDWRASAPPRSMRRRWDDPTMRPR